jgi:quercetin dioxygenase-like cupin family protein
MAVIRDQDVKYFERAPGQFFRLFVSQESVGSAAMTMGELLMQPGAVIALHTHGVEEAMYIAEGEATAVLGDETHVLGAGSVIYAPAGVKHSLATFGDKSMRFVFCYPAVNVQRQWITE